MVLSAQQINFENSIIYSFVIFFVSFQLPVPFKDVVSNEGKIQLYK